MKSEGCNFDEARLIYNKRKMIEAGVDPETGLPLPETLSNPSPSGRALTVHFRGSFKPCFGCPP